MQLGVSIVPEVHSAIHRNISLGMIIGRSIEVVLSACAIVWVHKVINKKIKEQEQESSLRDAFVHLFAAIAVMYTPSPSHLSVYVPFQKKQTRAEI